MSGTTFDREKLQLNLAKIKKAGIHFEVVIDSDLTMDYKSGKQIELREILKAEEIFTDAKKGMVAKASDLEEAFGTSDPLKAAEIIIKEGEIQLTAEYRQKMKDEKERKIIAAIHLNGVDPKTHAPHPPERIKRAMEEARIHVDIFKSATEQIPDIVKKIQVVLPIRFESKQILISIPSQHAPKCYPVVKSMCTIQKDEWQNDGSWSVTVHIPAGIEQDFYEKLNAVTHGDMETKVLKNE